MTSTCDPLSLQAYADNELSTTAALPIVAHLATCQACADRLATLLSLRAAIRQEQVGHLAPPDLAHSIRLALQKAQPKQPRSWPAWPTFSLGALGGAVAAGLAALMVVPSFTSQASALDDELVAGHVRSLQVAHLVDVASSDHHTVKPWFAGKLDFTPPVIAETPGGCRLIGGRLDYLGHQTVAALAYQCQKHVVNLYVAPREGGDRGPTTSARRGFNLVHWHLGHLSYDLVSDLNREGLKQLSKDLSDGAIAG